MNNKLQFIINHLKMESQYLDSAIESSLEMQSLLQQRPTAIGDDQSSPPDDEDLQNQSLQAERNERLKTELDRLRTSIADQFVPVLKGRQELVEVLKSFDTKEGETPSITALALMVEEPFRTELRKLRTELRAKLNQVQSISMGSQALLIYTLDFYSRLLTGLSKDYRQSNYYNSMGQSQNQFAGSLIKTNC